MKDPLSNVITGIGPISGKIYIARVNAKGLALAKREATDEILGIVAAYMQTQGPAGCSITFEPVRGKLKACRLSCELIKKLTSKRKLENTQTREHHGKTTRTHRGTKRRRPSRPASRKPTHARSQ